MAQVQVVRHSAGKQWLGLLALIGVVMATVLWWWSHRDDGAGISEAEATSAPAPNTVSAMAKPATQQLQTEMVNTEAGLLAQQAVAAREIENQPSLKPITGPIKERPAFVSEIEWAMLKGVADQSAQPAAELTRLVNKLRFMKQLELWQSLEHSTDTAKRRVLAEQLLDDLPQRVANADLDKPEAQKLQASLLKDAVSDEGARKKRAEVEARRLGSSTAS